MEKILLGLILATWFSMVLLMAGIGVAVAFQVRDDEETSK